MISMRPRLLGAEISKTVRRPFDVYVSLAVLSLAAWGPVILGIQARLDPNKAPAIARRVDYSGSLFFAVLMAPTVTFFLGPLFAASSVGHEYERGTWATLFSRRADRYPVVLAKIAIISVTLALICAAAVALWLFSSAITRRLLLGNVPFGAPVAPPSDAAWRFLIAVCEGLWGGLIAIAGTIITRSMLSGFGAGMLVPLLTQALASDLMAAWNPAVHFMNIRAGLTGSLAASTGFRDLYGLHMGGIGSALVLLIYAILVTGVSAWVLEKQDISV